jgi:hypothetical protein
MSRDNPDWMGKILIEKYGPTGVTRVSLNNTSQIRNAAYGYLVKIHGDREFPRHVGVRRGVADKISCGTRYGPVTIPAHIVPTANPNFLPAGWAGW